MQIQKYRTEEFGKTRMDIQRTDVFIKPDSKRVLLCPFEPINKSQSIRVCERINGLSEKQAQNELAEILKEFECRHRDLESFYLERFEQNWHLMDSDRTTSVDAPSPVKSRRKSKKPAQCGEQVECPLRSKCKAGACQPDTAKPNP